MLSSQIRGSQAAGRGVPVHAGRGVSAGEVPTNSHAQNIHDSGVLPQTRGRGSRGRGPGKSQSPSWGGPIGEDLGSISRNMCSCDTLFVILLPFQVTASKMLND